MKLLQDKIKAQGIIVDENILDVTNFFNGLIDTSLMEEIGKDFAQSFRDMDIDLVVTVESSGIAPSVFTSQYLQVPCLVLKKKYSPQNSNIYIQRTCYSYTHKLEYYLTSKREWLEGKRILLIDDFLAQGSVIETVEEMIDEANATLVGVGICISKNFQPGYKKMTKKGFKFYVQAPIDSMKDGEIVFS